MCSYRSVTRSLMLVAAGTIALVGVTRADPIAEFYSGKTLRLYTSGVAGGGIDTVARAFARHFVNHLPGKPNAIVINMPGASGIAMANWAYNIAPADGTIIAYPHVTIATNQVVHSATIKYDAKQFNWIGNVEPQQMAVFTWHTSPTKTMQDARTRDTPMAASSRGSPIYQIMTLSNQFLGTKFKIALGYDQTRVIAVERGEVEGTASAIENLPVLAPHWVKEKLITYLAFNTDKRLPDYPAVPTMRELTDNNEHRKMFDFMMLQTITGRSILAPPKVPKERVQALRRAFDRTMRDPQFLAEMGRLSVDIKANTGEQVQEMVVRNLSGISPTLAAQIVQAIN